MAATNRRAQAEARVAEARGNLEVSKAEVRRLAGNVFVMSGDDLSVYCLLCTVCRVNETPRSWYAARKLSVMLCE